MKYKKKTNDEPERNSPLLSKLPRKEGFTVPDGYFDDLQEKTLARLRQDRKSTVDSIGEVESRRLAVSIRSSRVLAYAAAIALVLVIFFLIRNGGQRQQYVEVTSEEAYRYVAENIDAFNAEMLYSSLDANATLLAPSEFEVQEEDVMYEMLLEDLDMEDLETVYRTLR